MPNSEHRKIRKLPEVQAELQRLAGEIAQRAGAIADAPDGYGTDLEVGSTRARAHVWAKSGAAIHAEIKSAPLMTIAAEQGPQQ
ncbi:hypothetical protein PBI_ZOEJ_12 [Mycobacterium phage ZoeJ]|uniref:Head-to-tail connector protein n=1 Tax=Mycobacterium phage ZoeJ TaxID=1486427 RepID=A0A023W5J6_9CAUD|nr:neck protein [Mycobacterium phage ZoeJ]AHY26836.1 hypothetical protein PBI_ZOEJ_12 [Mycobacterium phage ZoeJ]